MSVRARQVRLDAELRRLRRDVLSDPLTGLANRRWLAQFARRAARVSPPALLSVILLDVDAMKRVNDRLGHPEGDRRLVLVARALAAAAGPGRRVVRFGGDEFLIPASGGTAIEVRALAADFVRAVRNAVGAAPGGGGTSASAGIALRAAGAGDDVMECLVATADRALRRAKAAGGNCVRWSWA